MGSASSVVKEKTDEMIDNYLTFGASRKDIAAKFHCDLNEDMIDSTPCMRLAIQFSKKKLSHKIPTVKNSNN